MTDHHGVDDNGVDDPGAGHHGPPRIVVLGGGYAGTVAANHLRLRADVDITVVNPRPRFVERIRLHQLVAGTGTVTIDYGSLLGAGIRLVVDTATRIDPVARTVLLASGTALDYDYVLYAVGSTGAIPAAVPGATEYAYPVGELEQAQRLRAAIEDLGSDAPITVVGGGLTGIELAAELVEQGRSVTLVCGGTLAPSLSGPGRRSVARWLARNGVTVLETAAVAQVRSDAVVLDDGAERPSAVTAWAGGLGVPELAARSGLRTDALGRLCTDETLTSVDDDRIVAAGDAAAPSDQPLRMTCQAAGPLGVQAADTVLSRLAGTAPAVIDQALAGAGISLGRRAGLLQPLRKDDTPVDVVVGGRLAAPFKEMGARSGVWLIRLEARRPGSAFWRRGGPRPTRPAGPPPVAPDQ